MRFEDVTVLFPGEMGFVSQVYCRALEITYRPYAQYERATEIRFLGPRQRRDREVVRTRNQAVVVVAGRIEEFQHMEQTGPNTWHSRRRAFDTAWTDEMVAHARRHGVVVYEQDRGGIEVE